MTDESIENKNKVRFINQFISADNIAKIINMNVNDLRQFTSKTIIEKNINNNIRVMMTCSEETYDIISNLYLLCFKLKWIINKKKDFKQNIDINDYNISIQKIKKTLREDKIFNDKSFIEALINKQLKFNSIRDINNIYKKIIIHIIENNKSNKNIHNILTKWVQDNIKESEIIINNKRYKININNIVNNIIENGEHINGTETPC